MCAWQGQCTVSSGLRAQQCNLHHVPLPYPMNAQDSKIGMRTAALRFAAAQANPALQAHAGHACPAHASNILQELSYLRVVDHHIQAANSAVPPAAALQVQRLKLGGHLQWQ